MTSELASPLPANAQQWLKRACEEQDPNLRVRAIEDAIRRVKLNYPQFFRQEQLI